MRNILCVLTIGLVVLNFVPLKCNSTEGEPTHYKEPTAPEQKETLPDFVTVPVHRKIVETGTIYADVLSRCRGAIHGDRSGRTTNVHETAHQVHQDLRNEYAPKFKHRINVFYCLNGRAVIIEEPKIRKRQVNKYIPANLRGYRWSVYMDNPTVDRYWDNVPTYIMDEWVAYVLGGMSAIEDVNAGRGDGRWVDAVSGSLEFSIYTVGLCMAIKAESPEYWETNTQFKSFVIYMLKQAHATYMTGSQMRQFKWKDQDDMLRNWLTSDAAKLMREFMRDELKSVWL